MCTCCVTWLCKRLLPRAEKGRLAWPLNGVRLAIALAVWRAGKGDRKALNGKGPVAMNQARLVHVLLLTPVQTAREPYTFEASPLGVRPVVIDLFP